MATLYAKAAGGNWSAASTWSNVNSAGADSSGPPTALDDVIFEAGSGAVTVDTGASVAKTISCVGGTGSYTGTLTHNGFALTVSGSLTFSAGMTYTLSGTPSLTFNAAATLITAGKLLPNLNVTSGTLTLGDNVSFTASKSIALVLSANLLDLNGKTISGNSATNRLFIRSNTLGSQRTITRNGGTFANCDFRDIALDTATDLSAITGNSGDCGGNSNITFTTPATQTWSGTSGGNWSANAWSGRVPLPQDDVVINAAFSAGQTVTADMPRLGKSIDWTGATGSPTWSTNTVAMEIYGSLTLISGMTLSNGSTGTWTFMGRGAFTLTSAGKNFASAFAVTMFGGTLTLQDAYNNTATTTTLNNGTLIDNGFSFSSVGWTSSNSNARAVVKTGTWTVSGSGSRWTMTVATNLSWSDTAGSVIYATSSSGTFNGGGLTYNNVIINASGTTTIAGSNTFSKLNSTDSAARTVQFTAGTTQTLTGGTDAFFSGVAGSIITCQSSSSGFTWTVSKSSGYVASNYISLKDSVASGGASFYAGTNSTSVSGNTGWIFETLTLVSVQAVKMDSFIGAIAPEVKKTATALSLNSSVKSPKILVAVYLNPVTGTLTVVPASPQLAQNKTVIVQALQMRLSLGGASVRIVGRRKVISTRNIQPKNVAKHTETKLTTYGGIK